MESEVSKLDEPQSNTKLIDVASGTGDIAQLYLEKTNNTGSVTWIEPNKEMLEEGKIKLNNYNSINWINSKAEKIPLRDNSFDYYTISFGIRNVTDINVTLKEAYRVLKPGGRFMCLEFSKINNEILNFLYQKYSKALPYIGKLIVGSDKPYKYLINSINEFYSQKELLELMHKNGFRNIEYRNISGGISAIHSGWKV